MFCCNPFKGRRRKERWGEMWRVKVVVVGDSQSGKTCLIQRYCSGTLPTTYTPTLFDSSAVRSRVGDRQVQMILQDTAGQEDLDRLRPPFYLHTDVIVVCFSLDKAGSWDKVRKAWVPEVRRYCGKHVPLLLVANKTDLLSSRPVGHPPPNSHHGGQGQGQGIHVVDELRPSGEAVCSDNNPAAFRDSRMRRAQDEVGENEDSGRDSGFFEVTDPVCPYGAHEDEQSLLADTDSPPVHSTNPGPRKTPSGKESVSRMDRVRSSPSDPDPRAADADPLGSTERRGRSLATQIGAVGYFQTSALHDQGIVQVFQTALTAAMATKQWRRKYRL